MKNTLQSMAIALFVLIVLQACHRNANETLLPELIRAEALMHQHPDSALTILEEMPMPAASKRLQHATWCLLLTHAQYKNYIDAPNDSLVNIAYSYFMKRNNPQRKALALYLEGSLNEEWGEVEKATRFYLEATKEIEQTEDYQLAYLIYTNLGTVYVYRALYQYAEEAYSKSIEYAKLSGNDTYISKSLSFLARVYASLGDWERSIASYKEAVAIARKSNDVESLGLALSELAATYTRSGDYLLALKHIQESIDIKKKAGVESEQSFLTKGDLYRHLKQQDSACYYLQKALPTNNIYTKRSAYQALYYLSLGGKNYKDAIEYGDKYRLYADSIQKVERSRALIEMQERYNKEKVINEKNQLKIEKDRFVRNSLIALLALVFVIGALIFIYQHKLIHKQRVIREHQEEIKKHALRIYENELQISRNEIRMNELLAEMEQNKDAQELLAEQQQNMIEIQRRNELLSKENQELQKSVSSYSKTLREKIQELGILKALSEENIRLRDREKFLCNHLLAHIEVLNVLKTKPKYVDATRWIEVIKAINWLFDNFVERLAKDFPSLTYEDIQLCCLIKLGMAVSDIATIVGTQSTSVSRKKLRMKGRIIQNLGKSLKRGQTLDNWLQEY